MLDAELMSRRTKAVSLLLEARETLGRYDQPYTFASVIDQASIDIVDGLIHRLLQRLADQAAAADQGE